MLGLAGKGDTALVCVRVQEEVGEAVWVVLHEQRGTQRYPSYGVGTDEWRGRRLMWDGPFADTRWHGYTERRALQSRAILDTPAPKANRSGKSRMERVITLPVPECRRWGVLIGRARYSNNDVPHTEAVGVWEPRD